MPKTILFVCTGNSCRSVMAKGIFQKMLSEAGKKDIRITSAGTAAPEGMKPPAVVEAVMKREGIDVSAHRTRFLTVDLIEEATLILVMEKYHRQRILETSPEASGKIFLLREFIPHLARTTADTPDPIGRPLPTYQKVFQEIKCCLQELIKKEDKYLT